MTGIVIIDRIWSTIAPRHIPPRATGLGCILLVLGVTLFCQSVRAQQTIGGCIVSAVQAESIDLDQPRDQVARQSDLMIPQGALIGWVRIVRRPIFDTSDPEQDNFLYRTLNALNTPTWESALRAQLVFDEGDVYQPGTLDESERILRQSEYLTAAWIGVTRVCGNELEDRKSVV